MGLFDILGSAMGGGQGGQAGGRGGMPGSLGSIMDEMQKMAQGVGRSAPGGMGGLLGAGALGALLGQVLPRGAAQTAGLAGMGLIAWNFYQKWAAQQQAQQQAQQEQQAQQFASPTAMPAQETQYRPTQDMSYPADPTAMLLLRTMVYAARADGHIDAVEQERINGFVTQMFPGQDVSPLLTSLMQDAIDPNALAHMVQSPEQAQDLYRLSCLIVDIDNFMERSYMDALGQALRLPEQTRQALEQEAHTAKQQLAQMV